MRFGYWMPIFGGWLRNVADEQMRRSDREKRVRVEEHQLLLDAERHLPRTPCTGRPAASHA